MTFEQRRSAYLILWAWGQYGEQSSVLQKDGKIIGFEHRCMQAGEQICGWLEEFGLATDQGYEIHLTQTGIDLMQSDEFQ